MCLLHVLVTFVTILRVAHYKGYIKQLFESVHKFKVFRVKMNVLRYILNKKYGWNFVKKIYVDIT